MTKISPKAQAALTRILKSTSNLADNIREYTPQDFMSAYGVTRADAEEMYKQVQARP